MVKDLVKAGLSRTIHLDGPDSQAFVLAPPSIMVVLTLVTTYQDALGNHTGDHASLFRDTIREWMGPKFFARLNRLPWPIVVNYAMAWALNARQGDTTRAKAETEDDKPTKTVGQAITDIMAQDIDGRISDYASAYGLNPWEVMKSTPFDFFLAFVKNTERVRAQAMLDHLSVRSLPYQEESTREDQLATMYEMAGHQTEHGAWKSLTKEEKAKQGLDNLVGLEKMLRGG